ncbi:cytochrome c oxidase subunit 7C, mitochondrial-like [Styela clava]
MLLQRSSNLIRRGLMTSARRAGGHGKPTAQDVLPFNPFQNRWKLLAKMGLYMGTGFGLPFFAVYFQLRKKYGDD